MPPMVGTPFFFSPNGSMLGSRDVSAMFLRFMYLMKCSPNQAEMISARIRVSKARKEIYDQRCDPGISNFSKNLNR